ncbi:MAG: hypothetical protein SNJ53_04985 [Thermodesulfovibrionales bacterium]
MWGTIGGFLVSSIAEVFVKEVVKEVAKEIGKKDKTVTSKKKPLSFSSGQVVILEYVPTEKNNSQQ